MRADLNTTCDVITGPTTAMPGVIVFSGMCRFVPEKKEIPLTSPISERLAYVTMDAGVPVGPAVSGGPEVFAVDYGKSNLIAIPMGNVPAFQVLFTEVLTPFVRPIYYRAHVRYFPELEVLAQEDYYALLQEGGGFILIE